MAFRDEGTYDWCVGNETADTNTVRRSEARVTSLQRRALIVLGVGALIALGLAFGPAWFVRAGVGVAILAGLWALVTSFRELHFEKLESERRLIRQTRDHGRALSEERIRNGEVVEALRRSNVDASQRLRAAKAEAHEGQVRIVELTGTVGRLNAELSSLRGNNLALRQEVEEVKARLEEAQAELAELRAELDDDEVVALPRRAARLWEQLPSAEELWVEGNHPTVVDLQRLAFPTEEFREERKQA